MSSTRQKKIGIAILAAGEGKRLKINRPKVLVDMLGKSLLEYSVEACKAFLKTKNIEGMISIVTGHGKDEVESKIKSCSENGDVMFAFQAQQKGTADAVKSYFSETPGANETEYTLVMCGDTPLIRGEDLVTLWDSICKDEKILAVDATCKVENSAGYGRIVRSKSPVVKEDGFHIVEEKDCSDEEIEILEINSGMYIFSTQFLLDNLDSIGSDNKANEFYLTDMFKDNLKVRTCFFADSYKFYGVNTLDQLEVVTEIAQTEKIISLRNQGVRFLDSQSVLLDWDCEIAEGVTIYPNAVIEGKTKIGSMSIIGPGAVINNSTIEKGSNIKAYSYITDSIVREGAAIGPFAQLRPGSDIGKKAKVGNFVEVKKAKLGEGAKVSHLSYVGDAEIGDETNIGCGFITCNYDGANKHFTKIGKKSFIGSDCQMVAPVEIGDEAYVGSGSTITKNVASGDFAVGRAKQENKKGMAKRFLKKKM